MPTGDFFMHIKLRDLILSSDVFEGVVFDDEIGGEHG